MLSADEVMQDQTDDHSERVRLELIGLLGNTDACDLATIYRTLVGLMGAAIVADIGVVLGRLIREHVIVVETRSCGDRGPLVGYARLLSAGLSVRWPAPRVERVA